MTKTKKANEGVSSSITEAGLRKMCNEVDQLYIKSLNWLRKANAAEREYRAAVLVFRRIKEK